MRSLRAMLTTRRGSVLGVLLVSALLAGCGSSSNSGSSQTSTTTGTATSPPTNTSTTTTSGGDVSRKLDELPQGAPASEGLPPPPTTITAETERTYLTAVFNDAQRFWEREFSEAGVRYTPARLTLFSGAVHSGCGPQADVGPFYCGANLGVYLDLGFFQLLARHAGVGPFGQAYIVGHELGHHVQNLLGIAGRVATLNQQDPNGTNARSVRVELQADCLSGVWAHSNKVSGQLTEAHLNDALNTAALVGDDFQQRSSGRVVDSAMWTHGSSAQRRHWLAVGFHSGDPNSCDTFSSSTP